MSTSSFRVKGGNNPMATRGNFVSLYGYIQNVRCMPELNQATIAVVVTRSSRPTGDPKARNVDLVMVTTNKPEQVVEVMQWRKYDIVEVKGVINTIPNGIKQHVCPHCGSIERTNGMAAFVYPQFLRRRERFTGDDESLMNQCSRWLEDNTEVSNIFNCFAYLCNEPKRKSLNKGLELTEYQVVIHRAYRIAEDKPDVREDFVWVKSYGKNGLDDARHLQTSSQIYIDGLLQSRKIQQKAKCSSCGQEHTWGDRVLEIVPYSVQYLSNCLDEEEADQREQEKTHSEAQALLSTLKGAKPVDPKDAFAGVNFGSGMGDEEN